MIFYFLSPKVEVIVYEQYRDVLLYYIKTTPLYWVTI
jgi:hypothetical protein